MLRSGLIAKECTSAPLSFKTDQDHPNTRCAQNQFIGIHIWLHSTNESTERIGADAGSALFCFTNGAGPTPAPFLRFGVDSYLQVFIMTIEDPNGVDRDDRKAQWPHFLIKETRFCFVAQRVTNMRWGRRCWDCSESTPNNPYRVHIPSDLRAPRTRTCREMIGCRNSSDPDVNTDAQVRCIY